MTIFGDRIKQLREQKGLFQRQIANHLEIDTPMLSKIERGERNARRDQVKALSALFEIKEEDLLTLWLADKLYSVAKDELVAIEALVVAQEQILKKKKQK